MCSITFTSGLSASIATRAEDDFGIADALGGVDHLALQVRLVHDVVIDDPDRADPGGCEVERGRRAEAAGAEQEHLGVEQLQLALDTDLREQRVTRVAGPLRLGQPGSVDRRQARGLPGDDAALDHADVVVSERGELGRHVRGAVVGAAVEQEPLGGVRRELVDARDELTLGNVDRGVEVGLVPLVLLANVDQLDPGTDLVPGLVERDHLDRLLDLLGGCHVSETP